MESLLLLGAHVEALHVDGHMAEVLGDGSSWPSNGDLSSFDGYLNYTSKTTLTTDLSRRSLGYLPSSGILT